MAWPSLLISTLLSTDFVNPYHRLQPAHHCRSSPCSPLATINLPRPQQPSPLLSLPRRHRLSQVRLCRRRISAILRPLMASIHSSSRHHCALCPASLLRHSPPSPVPVADNLALVALRRSHTHRALALCAQPLIQHGLNKEEKEN
ncbi:hypothetical protein M0R45_025520 [Rubus argutus]|uniref:Uncharacterized protein n=1 Tax=Rubus argutus TaxID=59490 RepID=A0AAW1WWI1_RUBAR